MTLTPAQEQIKQLLEQGQDFPLTYPGLDDVVVHVETLNTFLKFSNEDGKHHFQLAKFPERLSSGVQVVFNHRIRFHSNNEIAKAEEYSYLEANYWPFVLANNPDGVELFGLKQAVNGLLRRLPVLGGSPQQTGPSLFSWLSGEPLPDLIQFDTGVTPETIDNDTPQADGEIAVTVHQGGTDFEFSIDSQTWADGSESATEHVFTGLSAGQYPVFVRNKDMLADEAPRRYQLVQVAFSS